MPAGSFTDSTLVHGALYATADRLVQRSGALRAAKIAGSNAATTIAALAVAGLAPTDTVIDIGCGRGTSTLRLAERLPNARLVAVDRSVALLAVARERLHQAGHTVAVTCADFHQIPLPDASVDVAVAAFCLYHSAHPAHVIAEIARCLRPGGRAVLVTKSADSYHAIDCVVAEAGLDSRACRRQSLYATFHSGNAADIAAAVLRVERVEHEQHAFRFADLSHLADYLSTSPKYRLPETLATDRDALAAELHRRLTERVVETKSTISYVVASRS